MHIGLQFLRKSNRIFNSCPIIIKGVEIRATADLENVDALILPGGESTSIGNAIAACPGDMLEKLRDSPMTQIATDKIQYNLVEACTKIRRKSDEN